MVCVWKGGGGGGGRWWLDADATKSYTVCPKLERWIDTIRGGE